MPQNCTYFQSSATALVSGQCTLKICKCSTDICQVSHQALQGPVYLLEKGWCWYHKAQHNDTQHEDTKHNI